MSFLKSTQIMPPVQINGKGHTSCFYHQHFILTKCVIEKFVECFHLYRNRKLERKWSVRNEIRKLCRKRNKVAVKIAAYFTLSGRWSNGPATKSDRQLGQERAVNIDFTEWNHTCVHQCWFLCWKQKCYNFAAKPLQGFCVRAKLAKVRLWVNRRSVSGQWTRRGQKVQNLTFK